MDEAELPERSPAEATDVDAALVRLARKVGRTRLALYWERLLPALLPVAGLAAGFLALAWLGLFAALPDLPRLGLIAVFALAALGLLARAALTPYPTAAAASDRLEAANGLSHRPLATLVDTQGLGTADPASRSLWQAHRRRLAGIVEGLATPVPAPRVDKADPYAMRVALVMVLIVGWTASSGDRWHPVADAVRPPVFAADAVTLYAWITPPAYTGLPPRGLDADADVAASPVAVPAGSRLTLRLTGARHPAAEFGIAGSDRRSLVPAEGAAGSGAFEMTVTRSGHLAIFDGSHRLRDIALDAIADRPPVIALLEQPAATRRGALHLRYRAADDYRVASARVLLAEIPGSEATSARPLVPLPDVPLALSGRNDGSSETTVDLTAHPRAGERVAMTLEARDDTGTTGRSDPVTIDLPPRVFANPLAAMLVDERRRLAADAGSARRVADTVETAAALGAGLIGRAGPILALRVIGQSLRHARTDDDLRADLDLMWQTALGIEDGDAADAAERLRQARAALSQALDRKAPADEIARLSEDLRKAIDDYIAALASELARNPDRLDDLAAPSDRALSSRDLGRMVDRLEDLARRGDTGAARDLLSRLDGILDNLRLGAANGRSGQKSDGATGKALDDLANIIRRQQELLDETHRLTPDGWEEGHVGDEMAALDDLGRRQRALERDLGDLSRKLDEGGMAGADSLAEAGKAMRNAAGNLDDRDAEGAAGSEGAAIEALRDGGKKLARAGSGGASPGAATDPLGRTAGRGTPDAGDETAVPGEFAAGAARRLLEELRRRYADPARPPVELDYLRRLITPY